MHVQVEVKAPADPLGLWESVDNVANVSDSVSRVVTRATGCENEKTIITYIDIVWGWISV